MLTLVCLAASLDRPVGRATTRDALRAARIRVGRTVEALHLRFIFGSGSLPERSYIAVDALGDSMPATLYFDAAFTD